MRITCRRRAVVLASLLSGIAVLSIVGPACSLRPKQITRESAEAAVRTYLGPDVGTVTVTCPDDIPARNGGTFTCTAVGADGDTVKIVATQTDDNGTFDLKPDLGGGAGTTVPGRR